MIKIGLIGCGRISQEHLKTFHSIKETIICAVSDCSFEKAKSVAEQYRCKPYKDYKRMIKSEDLTAVVVCTPPNLHARISIFAMLQGLHVLCEKPFAINRHEAEKMREIAKKSGVILMMASKFRFTEDVVKAKAIIESGLLGKIVLFENVFCSCINMDRRWNSRKKISGGGVLIDNGTHSVDIARFLLGPISFIQAQFGCQVQKIPVEDTARLYFKTRTGVMGTIDLSWSITKDIPYYISIYGTEGTMHIGWKYSRYKLHKKDSWVIFGNGYNKHRAFLSQGRHFLDCISGKTKPIITPLDALESVRVIEKAYESSRVNKWLEV